MSMDTLNAEHCLAMPEARKFIRELVQESCGVDIAVDIPRGYRNESEYDRGLHKLPLDLVAYLIYDSPKSFKLFLKDVELENNGRSSNE